MGKGEASVLQCSAVVRGLALCLLERMFHLGPGAWAAVTPKMEEAQGEVKVLTA